MLALESVGKSLVIGSLYPPKDSFRHERYAELAAPVLYPPPVPVLKAMQAGAIGDGTWPQAMIDRHDREYGAAFQASVRARNALWFAKQFQQLGVGHIHVHFANRATHTALFIKKLTGIPFSFTPHAQDFMVDLGSDALLDEMCREASLVVAVSDYSLGLLKQKSPSSVGKMIRVYNGLDINAFPRPTVATDKVFRILSIGRLIEFKGFQHLIGALYHMKRKSVNAELRIIGEGPWRVRLEVLTADLGLTDCVTFLGALSQEAVKAELAAAHVFALASTVDEKGASDILPTVITEAMACGLPVVSSNLAGIPEMVIHGETGLLTEPGDEKSLAKHLMSLQAHPEWASNLGQSARMRAAEIFSVKKTLPNLVKHFDAIPIDEQQRPIRSSKLWLLPQWPGNDALYAEIQWVLDTLSDTSLLAIHATAGTDNRCDRLDFLPDGIVLEASWRTAPDYVAHCEALRNQLGSAIDGEWFFRVARRAVWLAEEAPKRGITRLHGARSDEAVMAWLVHELLHIPWSGLLEPGHSLPPKLVSIMQSSARRLIDSNKEDVLQLGPPKSSARRIGPLSWTKSQAPISQTQRNALFSATFTPLVSTP